MDRLFVFTLGFHEDFAIRRLTVAGASRGDGFLCVTLKPAAGATLRAYNNLLNFASVSGVRALGLLEVDAGSPAQAVASIVSRVFEVSGGSVRSVVFDVSGGSRGVTTPAIFAAILLSIAGFNVDVYVSSEGGEVWEARFPSSFLKVFTLNLGGQAIEILRLLAESQGLQVSEIAERLAVHEKTVMNRVAELSKLDLVARRGRGGGVYLTQWGELLALTSKIKMELARRGEAEELEETREA